MTREQVMEILDWLGFGRDEYYVITGAALVMHGVRAETADVDMNVSPELFAALAERLAVLPAGMGGKKIELLDGLIEIFPEQLDQQRFEFVDGYPAETLASVRAWKLRAGRPKDLKDVDLIDQFLSNHPGKP